MKSNIKCFYAGVMGSPKSHYNGFGQAMCNLFEEYVEIPMSNVNDGLQGLKTADLVFIQAQDKGISEASLIHLKNIGAFVIQWTGDARNQTPAYCFEYAQHVDLSCFSNMRDVYNMQSAGYNSCFLQIGADENIYYPDQSIEKDIDIVFMGNNFGHFPLSSLRMEMVRELKLTYGDRFKAYGSGMPDGSMMGNQKGESDIYRRAKIGINLSHYDYERYTSDRMFRMLLSGVCILTHAYNGITEDFDPSTVIYWRDIDNLKYWIDKILDAEPVRKDIANQGNILGLNKYTFSKMAENIIELYNQHKNG